MIKSLVASAVLLITLGCFTPLTPAYAADDVVECWFPPVWKSKRSKADKICAALTKNSGVYISPRIADSYPEILSLLESGERKMVVYAGSFVQAVIRSRNLGKALVQAIDGRELYSGVMIYRKGEDPKSILKDNPEEIAFAVGASSGESSAKAATNGQARFSVPNHADAVGRVVRGRTKAAVVKNWWWEDNKHRFPSLSLYRIPGISEEKNADNVLSASKSVPEQVSAKIARAALVSNQAFGAKKVVEFDGSQLDFSIELMMKGRVDAQLYR